MEFKFKPNGNIALQLFFLVTVDQASTTALLVKDEALQAILLYLDLDTKLLLLFVSFTWLSPRGSVASSAYGELGNLEVRMLHGASGCTSSRG